MESINSFTKKFHSHNGFYNDGNSNYWSTDIIVDYTSKTVTTNYEETFGGQLAEVNSDIKTTTTRDTVLIDKENEDNVLEQLMPVIELCQRYPNREEFRFFSDKQKRFFLNRVKKAIDIVKDTDNYHIDCSVEYFVLPISKIIISWYQGHDGYMKRYNFKATVTHMQKQEPSWNTSKEESDKAYAGTELPF